METKKQMENYNKLMEKIHIEQKEGEKMNKDEYIRYLKSVIYERTKIAEERGRKLNIKAYKFSAIK